MSSARAFQIRKWRIIWINHIGPSRHRKKAIYKKLGISKDTELILYMVCEKVQRRFELKEIRKHGLELLFSALFLVMQVTCNNLDNMRMMRVRRGRKTEYVCDYGGGDEDGYKSI